jgi:transketolase
LRKTFQEAVSSQVDRNEAMHLLLGDIGVFGFRDVMERHPNRVLNMGIMEQSMIGFAAGIASAGGIPIVHTIAPFLVERPLEQLKVDFGYHDLPGKFISVGGSYDYSKLGASHHCPADVEIIGSIPNADIWCPAGNADLRRILDSELTRRSFTYVRLSETSSSLNVQHSQGVAVLKSGHQGTCVAVGSTLDDVLLAVEGLDIGVVSWVNPSSPGPLVKALKNLGAPRAWIVEPFYEGGSSRALINYASLLSLEFIGVPRKFIHKYGSFEGLNKLSGLDAASIRSRITRGDS